MAVIPAAASRMRSVTVRARVGRSRITGCASRRPLNAPDDSGPSRSRRSPCAARRRPAPRRESEGTLTRADEVTIVVPAGRRDTAARSFADGPGRAVSTPAMLAMRLCWLLHAMPRPRSEGRDPSAPRQTRIVTDRAACSSAAARGFQGVVRWAILWDTETVEL